MGTDMAQRTSSALAKPPLASPPPDYAPGSTSVPTAPPVVPAEHHHAPISAEQDIQYHQLFTKPATAVDLAAPTLPVAQLVEAYLDEDEYKSNDPKLNDAGLLYDYFRLKAAEPVGAQVSVLGYHTETEVYYAYRTNPHNNMREQVRQTRTTTITDFSFRIPLLPFSPDEAPQVTLWTLDHDPEVTPAATGWQSGEKWKRMNGLPGWADLAAARELYNMRNPGDQIGPLPPKSTLESPVKEKDLELGMPSVHKASSANGLKEICEMFVRDQGRLKQIEMKVGLYGWDSDKLIEAINNCIRSTGYSHAVEVKFNWAPKKYIVRPFNSLTKLKRNVWLMVLACVTLVYPIIWLYLRSTGTKGRKYKTVRADHALKLYTPVEGTFPGETLVQAHDRLHPHAAGAPPDDEWARRELVTGPLGVYVLGGMKEGAWLRKWEGRIVEAVSTRFRGDLIDGVEAGRVMGSGLDGY